MDVVVSKLNEIIRVHLEPRYSTTDHWIQESIKRIINSGLFWVVRAAEKKNVPIILEIFDI